MKVIACVQWDEANQACTQQAWIEWPGVLPLLPAEQGLELSAYLILVCAVAWAFKFLRRFVSPRTG